MKRARHCTGAILAGGAASRLSGAAKGLLSVGGHRIVDRVAETLTESCDALIVVSNSRNARDFLPGVPVVPDATPGRGPLEGVYAALGYARGDVIAVAWDAPFVPAALVRALRAAGEAGDRDVVAPMSGSPWGFEPLCAWYAKRTRARIGALLKAGDRRAGVVAVEPALELIDASSYGAPDDIFHTVNTPDDLVRAEEIARRSR